MSVPNSNLPRVQSSSDNASLKVVAEGNATISVNLISGGFFAGGLTSFAHNGGTDNLIWQVAMFSTGLGAGNNVPTPFESNDNSTLLHSYVDSNNLYVEAALQSTTGSLTPFTIEFYYRVMLP